MNITAIAISDLLVIEPKVFGDARGFFYGSFNQKAFNEDGCGRALVRSKPYQTRSAKNNDENGI